MSISFECPQCGKRYKVPESAAGRTSTCSGCGGRVTCPEPPAVDPYADLDSDGPVRLVERSPEPSLAEPAESGGRPRKKRAKGKRGKLRSVAERQKGVLTCILLQILLYIATMMTPPQQRPYVFMAYALVGLAGTVFLFMLAIELYNIGAGVLLGVLSLIPCIGLIILLVVSSKATRRLQDNGVEVGLMGADLAQFR